MGKNLLLDTDILIDWLNGAAWAKSLLMQADLDLYYSTITHKELLAKKGLSASERKTITDLLHRLRWVPLTPDIASKSYDLLRRYGPKGLKKHDALIAATAWSKSLILLTRNRKHFEMIREIELLKVSRNRN